MVCALLGEFNPIQSLATVVIATSQPPSHANEAAGEIWARDGVRRDRSRKPLMNVYCNVKLNALVAGLQYHAAIVR